MVILEEVEDLSGKKSGILGLGKMEKDLASVGRMLADPKLGGIDNPIAIVLTHMFGNSKDSSVEVVERWKANF